MTNARDKANIPVLNFQSKGIDDNADATAITIDSSERVGIGATSLTYLLSLEKSNAPNISFKDTSGGTDAKTWLMQGLDSDFRLQTRNDADNSGQLASIIARSGAVVSNHQFYTEDSERMRLTSTGLGIGTSAPLRDLVVSNSGAEGYEFGPGETSDINQTLHYNRSSSAYIAHWQRASYHRFDTPTTEAMRLTSTGLGIGESSPLGLLHVKSADSGASVNSGHNQVIAENSGNSGMTILSGTSSNGAICFGDSGNNCIGYLNYTHNGNHLDFGVNGSEKMRISSGGNISFGTTQDQAKVQITTASSGVTCNGIADELFVEGSGDSGISIGSGTSGTGTILFGDSGDNDIGKFQYNHSDNSMVFATSANERMRITSGGTLFVSNTSEPSTGANGAQISNSSYHIFCRNTGGSAVFRTFGASGEFRTLGNGNAQNTNNSYGAISDRVLKENEVDASSQWNDIKALQIKHYNFKLKPNEKQLGVIAQDLEASGMNGLVENNQDELYTEDDILPEGKNIGDVKLKNYKSVKYSILYMKSVKALQEAMERIETLEAKVTALETTTP